MKSYRERAVDQGQPATPNPDDELMPCRFCQKATPRVVLSIHGARCMECYRHYCEKAKK